MMSIWPFRTDKKSLADPSTGLLELFGISPASTGAFVSASTALQVPAVGASIRLISEAVASLDVEVKAVAADGTETKAPSHPVLPFLRDAANDWTSGFELIRDLVIDALSDDRGGLAHVNRASDGRVLEVIRYRSGVLSVDIDQTTGEPNYRLDNRPIPSRDVIHLRSPFGRSPLTLAREAIAVSIAMDQHAANLFARGARPSGVLMFPKGMAETAVRAARKAWKDTHEGDGAGGTVVLHDGATFEALTMTSTDAQFLENRKFGVLEIARAFRVPPSMIYDLDRATWSNGEQQGMEFLSYTLEPWLRALEGALRRALFLPEERSTHAIRFDRDDLTRADLQTRATTINSLIASKVMSPNEGRAWLGMEPREGGDTFENPNITTPGVPENGDTPTEPSSGPSTEDTDAAE